MVTTIGENGEVGLTQEHLTALDVSIGDPVDIYVRDKNIVIVKAGSKRQDWDEWFETAKVTNDFMEER
ncbi:MAG: hypothetical protein V7707_18315 [Motiliproteus sp.]